MRRLWTLVALGAMACLVAGCGLAKDKQSAELVADDYLAAIQNKDVSKAISLWDSRGFKKGITEKEWRKVLGSLPKKLGEMKDHKMVGWQVRKQAMAGMTGTFWALNYQVTYAKYPSQETITLFRPSGGNHFKVIGHNINCKGLLL